MNFSHFTRFYYWLDCAPNKQKLRGHCARFPRTSEQWMGTVDCFLYFAWSLTHIYNREGVSAVQDRQIET